ncbi:MAG: diguanylate cyclase [Deltaproteobacteria bacterium]|nr:diguanylate cyclase [Deltaproteobacteria bacterium]
MSVNQAISKKDQPCIGLKSPDAQVEYSCSPATKDLRNIIDKGPDAVIVVDSDGTVRFVNDVYTTVFGRKADQVMGTHYMVPRPLDVSIEIDIPLLDGSFRIGKMKAVEIEWNGGQGFLITVQDVTHRKKADQELRRTTEDLKKTVQELRRANQRIINQQRAVIEEERVKVLLQMAGATAHELNQPLTALLGNIDLIKLNGDNPYELNRCMDRIEEAGKKISGIIRRIQTIPREDLQKVDSNASLFNLKKKVTILSLEDTEHDFEKIKNVCQNYKNISLIRATCIKDAITVLERGKIDLILLDHVLPDGTSIDFLELMTQKGIDVPVVVITGQGDEMTASRLIQSGAYDYLPKNRINERSLIQAIVNTLEKVRLKKEVRDVQKKMAEMSTKDDLTGLFNRRHMDEVIRQEFSRTQRYHTDLSCLLLDLDFFKLVNDSFGHIFGDYVLKEFSIVLKQNMRESDTCFRYGGEEFMILLPNTDIQGAQLAAEKIRRVFETKIYDDGTNKASVTVSIGIASVGHHHPKAPKDLIAFADMALYRAKAGGRNRYVIYFGGTMDSTPDWEPYQRKNIQQLKERISSIAGKTRKASIASIALSD